MVWTDKRAARVRERVPDADEQDLLLLDDLRVSPIRSDAFSPIDPDARRRRLTALVNARCWPAPDRRCSDRGAHGSMR